MSPCACHQTGKQKSSSASSRSGERKHGDRTPSLPAEQGPRVGQLAALEAAANRGTGVRHTAQLRESLNGPVQRQSASTAAAATGLGETLQGGLEQLSGMDLSGVRVHYNSPKPAQLQALAYTQGQDIHVAPGQEKNLPHEGWHVVQQMQGRVQPTMELAGTAINDSPALEKEADVMGSRALQRKALPSGRVSLAGAPAVAQGRVAQRVQLASINKDLAAGDLAGHDFDMYSSAKLRLLAPELGTEAAKGGGDADAFRTAQARVVELLRRRDERYEKYARDVEEYRKLAAELLGRLKEADAGLDIGRGEIARNLAFLERTYSSHRNLGRGFRELIAKINKGRDGWDSEAAPYMRELFLGITELGRGAVQFGSIGGVGGDLVVGLGTGEVSTIQSKYFAGGSLRNVEDDIHKAIEQLGGKYGERPVPDSRRVVDAVVANPTLAGELDSTDVRALVNEALRQAARTLNVDRAAVPVDQILIALPTLRAQYRVRIAAGEIQSLVRIGINPTRFDLPELHEGLSGGSIERVFRQVEGMQRAFRAMQEELEKIRSMISGTQGAMEKVHEGTGEEEDEGPVISW